MKTSHRKGISLEHEYGPDVALIIKKKYSNAALARTHKEHEYTCTNCNINFINSIQLVTKNKYCSELCQITYSNLKIVKCNECNSDIKKRIYKTKKYYFCNKSCYHSWQKKNIVPPQNESRKTNANSEEAIAKRRITCIQSGKWHDGNIFVNGMDHKRYTKLVRYITKSKRHDLQNIWDGCDYYTGEYIRDNFKLHWSHGDYPSIDHKISITEAMIRQITPEELCSLDNLVYTKKRINSMKRNMPYDRFVAILRNRFKNCKL